MATTDRSPRFELVKRYHERGLWSDARVCKAVECGWITAAEKDEILGKEE